MHSSGMRAARLLTVCPGGVCPGGCLPREGCVCPGEVCLPKGGCVPRGGLSAQGRVSAQGDVCPGGCLSRGCLPHILGTRGRHPPCGQTDTCENITFANFVCER